MKDQDNCFAWKEHGGRYATSGIPDVICCYRGRFIAFEVKTEKGKLSKLQEIAISDINKSGGMASIVRSVDDVKVILNEKENEKHEC